MLKLRLQATVPVASFLSLRASTDNTYTELTNINLEESMMANSNLAQHEQLLKLLEHTLKEIGDHHKLMQDSLTELQNKVNASWSKLLNLFVTADQLRSTRFEFEKQKPTT